MMMNNNNTTILLNMTFDFTFKMTPANAPMNARKHVFVDLFLFAVV
jgi:hypothetical protein